MELVQSSLDLQVTAAEWQDDPPQGTLDQLYQVDRVFFYSKFNVLRYSLTWYAVASHGTL